MLTHIGIYVNHLALRTVTLLVSSENMLYCGHGVLHAWPSATPLEGGASLDEVPAEFNYTVSVSLISVKYHRVVVFIATVNSYADAKCV